MKIAEVEAEDTRAEFQAIYDTYRTNGIGAAWQRFFGFIGLAVPSQTENAAPQQSA